MCLTFFRFEAAKDLLDTEELPSNHINHSLAHLLRLTRHNPSPPESTQRHTVFDPERNTDVVDGVENHLNGKIVSEPTDEGSDQGDREVGAPGAAELRGSVLDKRSYEVHCYDALLRSMHCNDGFRCSLKKTLTLAAAVANTPSPLAISSLTVVRGDRAR